MNKKIIRRKPVQQAGSKINIDISTSSLYGAYSSFIQTNNLKLALYPKCCTKR